MKISILHATVMASAMLLSSWFRCEPTLASECPAPSFAAALTIPLDAGSLPVSVAVGDFNGDGKSDLAVANWGLGNVSVLLSKGDGTFQAAVNYEMASVPGVPVYLALGDFNGDG